jgi:hypothetical protein
MVGIPAFNMMCINGRPIVVFEEGGPGNIKELTIRTRVIALD